jgi:hypothetical protein
MASEAICGMKSVSFGSEDDLDSLVQEVFGWINGQGPTRGANCSDQGSRQKHKTKPTTN